MNRHKSIWLPRTIGLSLTVLFLWAFATHFGPVQRAVARLELLAYDLRLNLTLTPKPQDKRIVIVDIDEQSLKAEGQWPWPRDKIARLVNRIFEQGATVMAFDVVFPEREPNRALEVAQRLGRGATDESLIAQLRAEAPRFDNDAALAAILQQHDTVLGIALRHEENLRTGRLPEPVQLDTALPLSRIPLKSAAGYVANNAALQTPAQHAGFFSVEPDLDGVYRRVPLLMRHNDAIYPALALEALRLYLLADQVKPLLVEEEGGLLLEGVQLGELTIPTDILGNVMVPYRGDRGSFPYLSATRVLRSAEGVEGLEGAIVLLGTTATGLYDLRATPVSPIYPGVEVHANLISAVLDNHFPAKPSWADGGSFVAMMLLGIGLALVLPRLSPLAMLLASIFCLALLIGGNFGAWQWANLIFPLALPALMVTSLSGFNLAYGFFMESKGRRHLKEMFGQYVPPQLVEEMSLQSDSFGFAGESREMSILFSDVRNFTTISEALSAAQLKAMLNELFTPLTRTIFDNRGTIDKYVGDMVMAFWGAPLRDERHAYHSVVTALAMISETERLQPHFQRLGFPPIKIGIGINTGTVNVGDMGSTYRRAYTVIGDAVNLASRLESVTKYYGVAIVVGEQTYTQTHEQIVYRELDLIRVKGKEQAVRIYEPLCLRSEASESLLEMVEQTSIALELYRTQQWGEAQALFARLLEERGEARLYRLYLERIATLAQQALPDTWDGVYERESK